MIKNLFPLLMAACLSFCGCSKEEEKDTTTTIYGTVFDTQTGSAVSAVQVSFGEGYIMGGLYGWKAFASSVTGMDGHFEMTFSQTDMYYHTGIIRAEKSGYRIYYEERSVTLGQGNKYQMDILLRNSK